MNIHPAVTNGARVPRALLPTPALPASAMTALLAEPPGPDWQRMRHALRRHRWFIVLGTLAFVLAGVFISQLARPTYTADTMLWIDGGTRGEGAESGPVRPQQVFNAEAWTSLLRSFAVLEGAATDARLYVSARPQDITSVRSGMALAPTYVPGEYRLTVDGNGTRWTLHHASASSSDDAAIPAFERGSVGDSIGRAFGLQWLPSSAGLWKGREIRFTVTSPHEVALRLREQLAVRIDEQANFMNVELSGTDPREVSATLNAVGARYVAQAALLQKQNLSAYSEILDVQVDAARQGLTAAEAALEAFRVRTATTPGDMESVRGSPSTGAASAGSVAPVAGSDAYYGLVASLELSRRERAALDQVLSASPDGGLALPALQRVASIEDASELSDAIAELTVKRNELRTLRYRYEDVHPPIQRLQHEINVLEQETIPPLVRAASSRMAAREAVLAPRVAASAQTLRSIPGRDREEGRLRRNVMLAGQLYESLHGRADGTRMAEASASADIRVLDPAVSPVQPSKDNQAAILLASLFGGLALLSGLALFFDRSDKRFRYPEQVSKDLGLTILGSVPHLRAEPTSLVKQKTSTPFQEAMRDIRLNLAYAHHSTGPLIITVTSPGSDEGKSFLSAHLARTFAEGGARTLLIDGDLRRGQLNERFTLPRRPGLSEYLRGKQTRERIVNATTIEHLSLISSGARHREAPELLGAPSLPFLLTELRDSFDVIICDSPPLAAGVDAVLLSAATGNMLMVVRTGVSHREVAASRLEVISRLPVHVIGAVLNDVPDDSAFSYYSHYALEGYEARSEEEALIPEAR